MQSDCIHMGLTQNWRVAQRARAAGVKMVPHNWSTSLGTMCNAHLVAATGGHMCEFFMYPSDFRYGLFKEPYRPHQSRITAGDEPGFGMELIDDFAEKFPYIPGPNTLANPRFPHAGRAPRSPNRPCVPAMRLVQTLSVAQGRSRSRAIPKTSATLCVRGMQPTSTAAPFEHGGYPLQAAARSFSTMLGSPLYGISQRGALDLSDSFLSHKGTEVNSWRATAERARPCAC